MANGRCRTFRMQICVAFIARQSFVRKADFQDVMKFFLFVVLPSTSFFLPSETRSHVFQNFARFRNDRSRSDKEARLYAAATRETDLFSRLPVSAVAEYQRTLIGLRLFHVRLVSAADPDLVRQCTSGAAHSIMFAAHVLPRYQLRN